MYTNFGGNTHTGTQVAQQISAHAAVGGITAVAQGGKFGHGFLSAGITKGITGAVHGGPVAVRLSASMAIGGTVSKISGGKFANGAKTAAFQFMFNEMSVNYSHKIRSGRKAEAAEEKRLRQKGHRIIDGRVSAKYDNDGYIRGREHDIVSIDREGNYLLSEVKYRDPAKSSYKNYPSKIRKMMLMIDASSVVTTARQAKFDLNAEEITLTGRGIQGGEITLRPDRYSIQWILVRPSGSGSIFDVSNAHDMNKVLGELTK